MTASDADASAANVDQTLSHFERGCRLIEKGDYQAACQEFASSIAASERLAESHSNLGIVLQLLGQPAEAIAHLRQAVALKPDFATGWNNLAVTLNAVDRFQESLACSARALNIDPLASDFHMTRGASFHYLGRSSEAIAAHEMALLFNPHNQFAHMSLGIALLTQGDFHRGWSEYEWRTADSVAQFCPERYWRGGSLSGRTLLVRCEQGFGDAIQFVRYGPLLRRQGVRVILECRSELVRLFEQSQVVDQVIPRGEPLPAFDAWCFLLSLPGRCDTRLETVPAMVPYLAARPEDIERWRMRWSDGRFCVGIAWSGSPKNVMHAQRSIPLVHFLRLADVPGVRLVSLQIDQSCDQLAGCESPIETIEGLRDFADTAAAMMALDLVISCDTAPAHLAGSLGRPTWVALPTLADWRWMHDRSDSPWYPTMRLFRQSQNGDWERVFQEIEAALREFCDQGRSR